MKVLLLDLDIFSAAGGGQTFYRRVVERHPDVTIFYPSRGSDLRMEILPANARPFAIDPPFEDSGLALALAQNRDADVSHIDQLCSIARAVQGDAFDLMEVPPYRPDVHLVRPIFAAHGVRIGEICASLPDWVATFLRNAPGGSTAAAQIARMEALEQQAGEQQSGQNTSLLDARVLSDIRPLSRVSASRWRPFADGEKIAAISVVIVCRSERGDIAITLASLARQMRMPARTIVVAEGQAAIAATRHAVEGYDFAISLVSRGQRGWANAANDGLANAETPYAMLLQAGDVLSADALEIASSALASGAVAYSLPWDWTAQDGSRLPEGIDAPRDWASPGVVVDRRAVLAAGGFASADSDGTLIAPEALPLSPIECRSICAWRPTELVNSQGPDPRHTSSLVVL